MFDAEVWKPVAGKAEMESTRFHDLRHLFGTELIANNELPPT
jgi:integrase